MEEDKKFKDQREDFMPSENLADLNDRIENTNKEYLDKEKAAYLFDKDEIEYINEDLKGLSGELDDTVENIIEFPDILKERWKKDEEKCFHTANISIKKEGDNLVCEVNDSFEKQNTAKDEVLSIEKELANQKGIDKIWTINEKFGIYPDSNITEDEAFNRLIKEPKDIYSDSRRKKLDISEEMFPVVCPLCDGMKYIKIGFIKLKCSKCKAAGKLMVKSKEYCEIIKKNPEAAYKEEPKVEEKKLNIIQVEDQSCAPAPVEYIRFRYIVP
jgi:hypothetical protein